MSDQTDKLLQALRNAAKEVERLRAEKQGLVDELNAPIAIVGMACRFPGGVTDPESFWKLLDDGRDAITEVPASRWDIDALYDPDPDAPGKMMTRYGGFIADVDQFDPTFFGISPREATSMDPQQRLLLETSWEALERAGIVPDKLMGTDTGVFVGLMYQDYSTLAGDVASTDGYRATGNAGSVASGRISYVLGLKGPSMTVDTACSSSLVTLHLASQALRQGECSLALAGGVALMLTPNAFVEFSRLRGLAPDGRCKSFSAAADGVAWSEGCGMLVLKRLRDAQRDGDPILAIIRGSAVNQDGRSNGLTAPNGPSQQAVIRRALAQAGVAPAEIDYVECHGTGTPLGDPIEVQALGEVLAPGRGPDRPVLIGSAKSNIGHTQAAAGVAGIMKVVLALEHGRLPKNLHFDAPSQHIAWSELPVKVAAESVEWPRTSRPRRAGVSSFGISGTNAHVVLEEGPAIEPARAALRTGAELLTVSAKQSRALDELTSRLHEHLDRHPDDRINDIALSLGTTRSQMSHRLAVVATSRTALRELLDVAAQGKTPSGVMRGTALGAGVPKVVFIFPGQGSQWLGMGRQLLEHEPSFRSEIERCDREILAEAGWSLLAELQAEEPRSRLQQIDVVQPVLFSVEVALAALWRSWGIEPAAVVGHSMGEIAAAYVAGALSLRDAVAIICRRSRLMRRVSGQGEMALVELSLSDAAAAVRGREDRLSVAVSNSPRSTVLSGEPSALGEVLQALQAKGVFCRRVKVDVASHSPQVDGLRGDLVAALHDLQPRRATLPMVSTVTLSEVAGTELTATYWADNLREPVRFADAVQSLARSGHEFFVEISPHPILMVSVEEICPSGVAIGSLRRDRDERASLLESLGALWVRGYPLAWDRLLPEGGQRVSLPTYPWQRQRYWSESTTREQHQDAPRTGAHAHEIPDLSPVDDVASIPEAHSPRSWRGHSPSEARAGLELLVRETVASVLGFPDAEALASDRGFAEQGLDSLMAVRIRNRLQAQIGVDLSATLAFDHPTVTRLVNHLLTDVLDLERRSEAPRGQAATLEEPIAIIGAACRFPGGADNLESYWRLLSDGVVATVEIPGSRWSVADWYDPNPDTPNRTYVKRGGFLRDVESFDSAFFRIFPREAVSLDPQQRLLLEVSWEALEHARVVPALLSESSTGVFLGVGHNEYLERLMERDDDAAGPYVSTGNMLSVAAGRLSYFLGVHGPTLAVDTACSSSLVALHLACQSLHVGECDQALVGGANLLLEPGGFVMLSRMRALAPDGRCKTFSAAADGYARAEGCSVVVLKRLRDAQRDGDRILAIIRGAAINHDGASSGLTVPNGPAQQAVLRHALAQAGVAPAEVDFVECHGTGTALGDPIEVHALSAVYGRDRPPERPLVLGSAKANIGHLEPAAGMAGLVKVLLALQHEQIPPQPELGELNPHLPWDTLPVEVPRKAKPWIKGSRPRRAGVSAFGLSGTNAHVLLEEAPVTKPEEEAPERPFELVALSARTPAAVEAVAGRVRDHLDVHPELRVYELALSLATTRSPMDHRLVFIAASREGLRAALDAIAGGQPPPGVVRGTPAPAPRRIGFLFTGQGSQGLGMGRVLHREWPAFRAAFDECVALFNQELARPLPDVMWANPGSAEAELLDQTALTQPAIFTLEYALAALWRSWGVQPELVAGHSIGEIAAACVAGVFSLEDAVRLVAARGRLMQALPPGGAMVSIAAPEDEVAAAVSPYSTSVSIAAINDPQQVVIAGADGPVQAIAEAFSARGARTKSLRVSHAFHSPLMEPMLEAFARVAEKVTYRAPSVALVSNVTGRVVSDEVCDPRYWVRHVREAVRFWDGVGAARRAGVGAFIELGPKPTLIGLVRAGLRDGEALSVASLRPGRDETASMLEALGTLWCTGTPIRWTGVFPVSARRVDLPTYPWQRQRHWIEAPNVTRTRAGEPTGHPLLGVRVPAAGVALYETLLGLARQPWLADHRAAKRVLTPGAVLVELVQAAAAAHGALGAPRLVELLLPAPLLLPETGAYRVQVLLAEDGQGLAAAVYSQPAESGPSDPWTRHLTASVVAEDLPTAAPPHIDLAAIRARCTQPVDVDAVYARFAEAGLAYGPAFRGLVSLWSGQGESLATVALPVGIPSDGYRVHPALFDAAGQTMAAGAVRDWGELMLPFAIGSLSVYQVGAQEAWVHTTFRGGAGGASVVADVTLADEAGTVIAHGADVRLQRADREALRGADAGGGVDALYHLDWREVPQPAPAPPRLPGRWVVIAGAESLVAAALVERLEQPTVTDPAGVGLVLGAPSPSVGIVCVWEPRAEGDDAAAAERAAIDALSVVNAIPANSRARVWWVTSGAVPVQPREAVTLPVAPLWGLGRTVMQERPELKCKLVDLPHGVASVDELMRELSASDEENQVAWRAGRRYAARLTRAGAPYASPEGDAPRGLRHDGTVVLSGGLGALGLHVARWLAQEGVAHIVLMGRRGMATPGAAEAAKELEALGAQVTVAAADVADRHAVRSVLEALPKDLPLRGVIHAAGALDDGVLTEQSPERFMRVFAPKIRGAWNLHELTRDIDLDAFVLFSSMAGVLGSPGQGNYAAANAFLDGLVAHRRAGGLAAQSIAWGPWSAAGMAAELGEASQARLARQGFQALSPAQGVSLLGRAMSRSDALLGVVSLDLKALGRALVGVVPPVWRALVRRPVDKRAPADTGGTFAARLAALPRASRLAEVRSTVQADIARVLSLSPEEIPFDRPFSQLGMDSLMAVEVRNALVQRVGTPLPATVAFDYSSVDALASWLLEEALLVPELSHTAGSGAPSTPIERPAIVPLAPGSHSSLGACEETRMLPGDRAARLCVRRGRADQRRSTLLLLHGGGANHHYFAALAERLEDHDLLIPSLPGRCGSDGPAPSTVAEAAGWVRDLLSALNMGSVIVVGHSYGGAIAQELAIAQSALPSAERLVHGLVLIATGPQLTMDPRFKELANARENDSTDTELHLLHRGIARQLPEASLREIAGALALTPKAASVSDLVACEEFSRGDALARIDVPTLVIAGSSDPIAPPRYGRELAESIPRSQLVVLDGVGHHPPLEATTEVAEHIRDFVLNVETRRDNAGVTETNAPTDRVARQFILKSRPSGALSDDDLEIRTVAVRAPEDGEIQVRVRHLSIDPTIRPWMSDTPQYMPPIKIGEVVRCLGTGVVERSRHPRFRPGDRVMGLLGWQTHVTASPEILTVSAPLPAHVGDQHALGVLGLTSGLTAYFGVLELTKPKAGETVVVTGAAGSVGGLAGQIAKLQGCRVVGVAGGPEKCRHVVETLGFDACIDYKNEDVASALDLHCPSGIDVDFENVGGPIFDEILLRMNLHGRVALCGLMSGYNRIEERVAGPYQFAQVVARRVRIEGFVVTDYAQRFAEASAQLGTWVASGKLRQTYNEIVGFDKLPDALRELLSGQSGSIGKMLVRLEDSPADASSALGG